MNYGLFFLAFMRNSMVDATLSYVHNKSYHHSEPFACTPSGILYMKCFTSMHEIRPSVVHNWDEPWTLSQIMFLIFVCGDGEMYYNKKLSVVQILAS